MVIRVLRDRQIPGKGSFGVATFASPGDMQSAIRNSLLTKGILPTVIGPPVFS
jgi:hypothetical protein